MQWASQKAGPFILVCIDMIHHRKILSALDRNYKAFFSPLHPTDHMLCNHENVIHTLETLGFIIAM